MSQKQLPDAPDIAESQSGAPPQRNARFSSAGWKLARAVARVCLLTAAVLFLLRLTRAYWPTLDDYQLAISWPLVAAASGLWLLSYLHLIGLWARSLAWWNQAIPFAGALRLFLVSNLARYVPGAVWQFASVAVMAVAAGVSPLAAASAIVVQQCVLLATGLALTLSFASELIARPIADLPRIVNIIVALAGLWLIAVALPRSLSFIKRVAERTTNRSMVLPDMSSAPFSKYMVLSVIGWVGYSGAFYVFAHGVIPGLNGDPIAIGSAFVGSYVAGIVAVFAPGGIVVREAALVAALGPQIGTEHALALALMSRVWLVSLDILATALFLFLERVIRS